MIEHKLVNHCFGGIFVLRRFNAPNDAVIRMVVSSDPFVLIEIGNVPARYWTIFEHRLKFKMLKHADPPLLYSFYYRGFQEIHKAEKEMSDKSEYYRDFSFYGNCRRADRWPDKSLGDQDAILALRSKIHWKMAHALYAWIDSETKR